MAAAVAATAPGDARADSAALSGVPEVTELAPYLQCVPYARERSGVEIYGDARTWWDQAAGRYKRGTTPKPGAVMTFRPTGSMVLGHVAAVSRVAAARSSAGCGQSMYRLPTTGARSASGTRHSETSAPPHGQCLGSSMANATPAKRSVKRG